MWLAWVLVLSAANGDVLSVGPPLDTVENCVIAGKVVRAMQPKSIIPTIECRQVLMMD